MSEFRRLLERMHADLCQSKFGQLLRDQDLANPIVHSFVTSFDSSTAGVRLNLGVGGDGVVGRTVSIVDSRRRLLGEGVIGWS